MSPTLVVNEVGPRDGLQNQAVPVSLDNKIELIHALVDAGIVSIEATSFVSPKAVPQMADADELLPRLPAVGRVRYSVLVPNERGLQRAISAGAQEIAVVLSATETMNRRNINMGLGEAQAACEATLASARNAGIRSKAYIAVAFECPYEGLVSESVVRQLVERMLAARADEIVIADTIGAASPRDVTKVLGALIKSYGAQCLSIHLHDTRGMAVANAWAAMNVGCYQFDSSIGGLGGCPFAPGARGNLATEDLVLLANQCGFDSGIALPKLLDAVDLAARITRQPLGGRSHSWLLRQYRKQVA